jgi:chromosome segregation protein
MHLKSISLKGFKSFPDRTRLEFGPGVSVIVGPNGSGKSNITDAVLWAMGEQSPLAVRGQAMQDVIFGGARGQQARGSAEVEVIIDNSDGALPIEFTELSIMRRLDRSGEGEYRVNGARCRLVDVLEALSDTGLGKESHSIVSQGRVEGIVTSKPKDRRLLIEEAAGLGKHRKRRRRAQLKLKRTEDNLDRSLDVEREARARLRPLKRQSEAAELHARLERQTFEARWTLARDEARVRRAALAEAEAAATGARAARDKIDAALAAVRTEREQAEQALASRGAEREILSRRLMSARAAAERLALRLEHSRGAEANVRDRAARARARLELLDAEIAADAPDDSAAERIAALEAELTRLAADAQAEIELEVAALEERRAAAAGALAKAEAELDDFGAALKRADHAADVARAARREAEGSADSARREAARIGGELAAVNHFLRAHTGAPGGAPALADELDVDAGLELALAAALGRRMRAAIAPDLSAGATLLDRAGEDGGSALIAGSATGGDPAAESSAPIAGADRLLDHVRGPSEALELAGALLADAWVVDSLETLPIGFTGIAVTRGGRVWFGATRELRQVPAGGEDRVLSERNRREELIASSAAAAGAEQDALSAIERAAAEVSRTDVARADADEALRAAVRRRDECAEEERRAGWLIQQRREASGEGTTGSELARVEAALGAERKLSERAEAARTERARRIEAVRAGAQRDELLAPEIAGLVVALASAGEAVEAIAAAVESELEADRAAGEQLAADLRSCAQREAERQGELREHGETVTFSEVRAQQARDGAAEADHELEALAGQLGLEAEPAETALPDQERADLEIRIERLARRREQIGPVNPLAKQEYAEALEYVESLETQRQDLETALRELRDFIKDTDRRIRESFEETFEAAAKNFEEVVGDLFPGGRGRLRLVREDSGPRPVLGGAPAGEDSETAAGAEEAAEAAADAEETEDSFDGPDDDLGVEIEMTPAGKSMKRLSLLSGGEKSLTALAFLFAIFLARPCPFYVLDEVEAALDDLNIDRFLTLLRKYAGRAQFIVVTHQKRTMEAADALYGVSMGGDGISKVVSRRLPGQAAAEIAAGADAA